MIPKKIHYCWFGNGEMNEKARKCINSWKKKCPDYEIVEWNETNFDINMNAYTKYTYDTKQYAFLSDYARLYIIYREGGIYFDVDVETLKSLDPLLNHPAFFGFETATYVNTGIGFGAEASNPIVKDMLNEYDQVLDGMHGVIGCPKLNTNALIKHGMLQNGEYQVLDGAVVYPVDYFNPYDDPTGRLNTTNNTYSIHWFAKSWMRKSDILRSKITQPLHRLFGKDIFRKHKHD